MPAKFMIPPFLAGRLAWRLLIVAGVFTAMAILSWMSHLPWQLMVVYGAMSLVSLVSYALDKRKALGNGWRIRENTLLGIDLACGWPGGLLAQGLFRHKTRKVSYQCRFWFIVCLHGAALAWWCWPP